MAKRSTLTASYPGGLDEALARTMADAEAVGRDLGAAGLTLVRGTARLAYDVGSVVALVGQRLVGDTIRAAEGLARRAEGAPDGRGATLPTRKPLAEVGAEVTRPRRKRA